MRKRVNFGLTAVLRKMFKKKSSRFILLFWPWLKHFKIFAPFLLEVLGVPDLPWVPQYQQDLVYLLFLVLLGHLSLPTNWSQTNLRKSKRITWQYRHYTRGRRTKGKEHIKKVYHWVGSRQTGKCLGLGHDVSIVRNILLYSAFLFRQ